MILRPQEANNVTAQFPIDLHCQNNLAAKESTWTRQQQRLLNETDVPLDLSKTSKYLFTVSVPSPTRI